MALKIYNTMSRKKEIFTPLGKTVGLYTCGPTVYNFPHIGNLRAFVFDDLVKRSLLFLGYSVKHVMNITDVGHLTSDQDTGEDKMEKGAKREKKSVWEIAEFYTKSFYTDMKLLNILPADVYCKATDHIPEQIELVKKLEEKGYTYIIEDGVYFDTSKFPGYGKLARLDVEGLQAGKRVSFKEEKKNITDFALWKFSYPHGRSFDPAQDDAASRRQMEWDSPWGRGFPGWHIECSAMSMKYLGETFDIHCGGVDHIPVHHSNEIAQAEAATGKQFVRYWMHNEHLLVDGGKMSKSKGNFYTLQDLTDKGFSPRSLRYLFLSAHYRTQQNFTLKSLEQAQASLATIDRFVKEVVAVSDEQLGGSMNDRLEKADKAFQEGVEDDLNIPTALSVIFDVIHTINPLMQEKKVGKEDAEKIVAWLKKIDEVLGVLVFVFDDEIPEEIQALLTQREKARLEKDFALSDVLRKQIEERGYEVRDTAEGQKAESSYKPQALSNFKPQASSHKL